MSTTTLPRRFREARLDLELLSTPLARGRGTDDIVQIDIHRARSAEVFRLFPGARENRLEVLGADPRQRQLVLFVEEARHRFEVTVARHVTIEPGARVVREDARTKTVERFTDASKRHFLCGMDEQHLFIAQLPYGASSVHAAHEALRAPEVPPKFADRRSGVLRQGEWFFLPPKPRDHADVAAALKRGRVRRDVGIAQAAGIPRAGRPHVADEVLVIFGEADPRIFVRGAVRHPDHRTIELREWMRVVPNRERMAQPAGVLWVD